MKRIFIPLFLAFMMVAPVFGQSLKELEARKKKTLEQLELTNKLLRDAQSSKKTTSQQITLLNNNIKQANALISVLNEEISAATRNIDTLRIEKMALEERIAIAKDKYGKFIAYNEINRKHFSPTLYLLSSQNFAQAWRRFRYMQEVSNSYKQLAIDISTMTNELSEKEKTLVAALNQKEQVMSAKENESKQLETKKKQQTQTLSTLQKKEKDLKAQQRRQQAQAQKLYDTIQQKMEEIVRQEQERARKKAEQEAAARRAKERKEQERKAKEQGKTPVPETETASKAPEPAPKPAATTEYIMSKEDQLIAGGFEKNRGRMPMPVEKGFISRHFGTHPHPFLPNTQENNKGIYIQTAPGTDARTIYDGEVTRIFTVKGENRQVIIKHGNYFTLYSNLTDLYVKVGDKVKAKQKIGRIFTDAEDNNKTEFMLMLYKGTVLQNPELWIAR